MTHRAELWYQGDFLLAESPIWVAAEQAFYGVDIAGQRLWRHDGSTAPARTWSLPQRVGCIAPVTGGGWLAAMEDGVYAVTLAEEPTTHLQRMALASHAMPIKDHPHVERSSGADRSPARPPSPPQRFNDGRCDRQGRFWVGSMQTDGPERQPIGTLARLSTADEPSHTWQPPFQTGLLVPNGLAFSPDGRTMYFSDSHPSRAVVWSCDYDPTTGHPGPPRVFIDRLPAGRPDGAAVDSDGCYWICANDGAAVLRYTPQGRLDRRIEVPVAKPTMCAFGGPDLRLLLIATMRPEGQPPSSPRDGALFAVECEVSGLPEPALRAWPYASALANADPPGSR